MCSHSSTHNILYSSSKNNIRKLLHYFVIWRVACMTIRWIWVQENVLWLRLNNTPNTIFTTKIRKIKRLICSEWSPTPFGTAKRHCMKVKMNYIVSDRLKDRKKSRTIMKEVGIPGCLCVRGTCASVIPTSRWKNTGYAKSPVSRTSYGNIIYGRNASAFLRERTMLEFCGQYLVVEGLQVWINKHRYYKRSILIYPFSSFSQCTISGFALPLSVWL